MATLKAIFTAQDNLSSAMAKAGNAGSKTTGIMQKLGKLGSAAMKGIVAAVTAAGTALLAFGKKAIQVGMNFETSMSQVMATMGIDKNSTFVTSTGEIANSYEMMSAAAEKMGAETAFTSSQAADALNYLALAGYDAEQATAALPTVLHLAGAGGMELATASDMVTDSMAALGLEVNQTNLDRFADQMAKTASTTNTSVSQLGEATLTVGAVAKNLRNDTTELNTQLGILANVGIKGAEGGTHLRNVLLRLQNPTAKASKQLDKLGVAVYDTDGKMRDTGEIFADLNKAMEGMSQQEIDQVMSTIFNKTDIAAANALLAASGGEYQRIFSIIENSGGAAAEMYMTMLDNLKGDVDIFNSATEALYLTLYKSANGTLRKLVQTGTGYMNRLLEAFNTGGFEGLANELGNVMGDAVSLIVSYAPKLIEAGTSIILAFVDSIGNNADTVADAAVKIGIQLVVAIGKIAPKLASAFVKMVGSAAASLLRNIPSLMRNIPDSFYNALGLDKHTTIMRVGQFVGHMSLAIRKLFSGDVFGSIDSIGKAFNLDEGQIERIKNIVTQLGAAFEKVKSAVLSVARGIGQFIGKFAKIGGIEATVAGLAAGFAAIKAINVGKSILNFVKGIKKAGGVMKLLAANKFMLIAAAIGAVVAGIVLLVKNWDKVKAALKGGIDKVFGAGTFDKLSQSMSKVGQGFKKIGDWAKDSWGKMKSAFSEGYENGGLFGGISAAFGSLKKSLAGVKWGEIGSKAWEAIKSGFSATGDWIKSLVLGDSYTPDSTWGDVGSKIWETIKGGISVAGDWIKQKVLGDSYTPDSTWVDVGSKIWETIKGGISATGDWLKEKLGYSPSDSWSTIGADLWNKIKSGISATGDWLKTKLGYTPSDSWSTIGKSLWNKIKSGISATGDWLKTKLGYSPSDSWSSIGSDLWEKIKSGITATGDWLKTKLGYTPDASWSTIGSDIWEKIKSGISATGDWLKTKLGYTPSDSWSEVGSEIWRKIWSGIEQGYNTLKEKLDSLSSGGGAVGTLSSLLSSALSLAESVASGISGAIEKLKADDAPGSLWSSVKSIVDSILSIAKQVVSAFTGATESVAAGSGDISDAVSGGIVTAVEAISAAVQAMSEGLKWLSDAIAKLNEAGALVPILEGIGGAILTYFTANAIMNVVNFFKAFSAGSAIFSALNPHILAIAAAVAGLVALISWAHNQVKREDKTWGDYKEFDLQEIEMQADVTFNPKVTNGEEAMQAINAQIAQMVERGTFGEDIGAKLSDLFSQYMTPEGMDWEAWFDTGHNAAMELLNGVSEGMASSTDIPNPAEEIISTMNQTFESITGQTVDFSSMYSSMDTAADQAASNAMSTLNNIASDLETSGFETAGSEAVAGYAQGISTGDTSGAASALVTAAEDAVRAAQQSGSPAAAYMPIGAEAAQGYGMGLQQEDVSSYAQSFATAAMAAVTAATQAEAAALTLEAEGTTVISTYAAGMTAGSPAAVAVMTALGVAIRAVAQAVNLTAQGSNMLRTLTAGMNSGRSAAVSSARTTGSGIRSAFSSINLYSVGSNIVAGLRNGMNAMFSSLLATARSMAARLKSTIQSGMQVHSPSRFTDWIGRMTGLGLINSLEKITPKVTAAAAAMAVGVTSAFSPVALATPSINTPAAITQDYSGAATPLQPSVSPYETLQGDGQSGASSERHIVIDIQGGGRIDIGGLTKEQAMELIAERVKPELMAVLEKEIMEGGNGVYEF